MPIAVAIPCFVLVALSCVCAVYYGVVLWRARQTAAGLPTTREGLLLPSPDGGWPAVCIIIPAHNEAGIIEHLARSLVAQDYPNLRIVFSLDRCTDDTEGVVRRACSADGTMDARVEIVRVAACPEGWAGKTHAAWRGVRDSRGAKEAELLLFADADTVFDAGLARAAVGLLHARRLDLLSLLSELTCETWFERLVQPAAGFELIRQYPLDMVNREARPRAFANGQFMLFRRSLYDAIGGHERVKHELLEDIALARYLDIVRKEMPSRWGVLMTDGMLRCRMYRDWAGFRRGWKRIYTEACLRRPRQLREWMWRQVVCGAALPGAGAASAVGGVFVLRAGDGPLGWALLGAGAAALAVFMGAMMRVYRDQGVHPGWALTYPFGAGHVAAILREAARDLERGTKTIWGGREYAREVKT